MKANRVFLTFLLGCGGGRLAHKEAYAPPSEMAAPYQTSGGETYAHVEENAPVAVKDAPLSTFAIDVDTASYANVRRFLVGGSLPPVDAVRVEEMVNYFDYAYPVPKNGAPFAMVSEIGPCPWDPRHELVHIGLQGRRIEQAVSPPSNLVFLVDVSGSMSDGNKLPLVKAGLRLLAQNLREEDRLSIVVYAGASGLALPPTSGVNKERILSSLDSLEAGGSTNGGAGIELAYRVAREQFRKGGVNRVVLATDGDFNVGATSHDALLRLIEEQRKSGVYLTVLGVGGGNLRDSTMEMLADKGNGNYHYLDSLDEAKKVLVAEAGGTLVTIAKDVKIQVEFNAARVESYRLVGYENRKLANEDFHDDKKDAGEIGAGHNVTAIYEIVPAANAPAASELMKVRIRYKDPEAEESKLLDFAVKGATRSLEETSDDFRFSAAVAAFGLLLKKSELKGDVTPALIASLAEPTVGADAHRREFLQLVDTAARLMAPPTPQKALAR
jgi:Ca-activated chloride channel homolog